MYTSSSTYLQLRVIGRNVCSYYFTYIMQYTSLQKSSTLPETNSSPLKIARAPKGNNRIPTPTIHFQMRAVSISTYIYHFISPRKKNGTEHPFLLLLRAWILVGISLQPTLLNSAKIGVIFFGKECLGNKNPCLWRGNNVIWCNPKPWME